MADTLPSRPRKAFWCAPCYPLPLIKIIACDELGGVFAVRVRVREAR
jgi:hypothetical protein